MRISQNPKVVLFILIVVLMPTLSLTAGILRLSPRNSIVNTLVGSGKPGYKNGTGKMTQFQWPTGITVGSRGNFYVADFSNNQIRRVSRGGEVTTYAGNGIAGYSDGPATLAMFRGPEAIALDHEGNLFIADSENYSIRKISPDRLVTTIAGSNHPAYRDGIGLNARFIYPTGITIDPEGNLFVADRGSHTIRKINKNGIVTTVAGDGTAGYRNGSAREGKLFSPVSLVLDLDGNLFVSDSGNHSIRKITPDGTISTVAGGGIPGFRDGVKTEARFHWPTGIGIDDKGNLFVSDSNNSRIRKITPDGEVVTLAGIGAPGYVDGPGFASRFNFPTGLHVDRTGNLYITDSANHLIRTITPGIRSFVEVDPHGLAPGIYLASMVSGRGRLHPALPVEGATRAPITDTENNNDHG